MESVDYLKIVLKSYIASVLFYFCFFNLVHPKVCFIELYNGWCKFDVKGYFKDRQLRGGHYY